MNQIIYFSPTGNAKYLAKKLSENIDESQILPLEFTNYTELKKSSQLIILFSIHGFNSPRTVDRFVNNLPEGLCENISLIAVGCAESWINLSATTKIRKKLIDKKYNIIVDEVMAMPLTLVMDFPDDIKTNTITNSNKKIVEIAELIKNKTASINYIPFKSKLINFVGKGEDPASRLFGLELHANKSCTSCGLCIKRCPEKNIKFNKKEVPKFGLKCIMCLRCVYECPTKSISPRFAKFITIKGGYKLQSN